MGDGVGVKGGGGERGGGGTLASVMCKVGFRN